jgi:hypothetical protein
MEQEWQKRKSAQSLQVDLRRQGTPEPSEGALEVKRGSRQLPKVSFNATVHLPGRLQGRCVAKNRNGGPVKCKGWFAAEPSEIQLQRFV